MFQRLYRLEGEEAHYLVSGQIVIVIARWLLILTSLVITVWQPPQGDLDKIRISLFVMMALAAGNFYLHARVLMRRQVPVLLVYAASAADLVIISLLTAVYGGFAALTFVFYYPAAIGLALAFPRRTAAVFTGALLGLYTAISLPGVLNQADTLVLLERLLSIAGVIVVGSLYLGIERDRRRAHSIAFPR